MELTFAFTVEEVNLILQALGARPYAEVQALIEKIKGDGEAQIAATQIASAQVDPREPAPQSE